MFSLILYLLCVLVFLPVLVFLVFTGYLHYVHWKYSHIPQPKRPRLDHISMHSIKFTDMMSTIKFYHCACTYSFYLGHLPDLTKDGNQELSFVTVFLQWYKLKFIVMQLIPNFTVL